jgi:hypothetical protein
MENVVDKADGYFSETAILGRAGATSLVSVLFGDFFLSGCCHSGFAKSA